MGNAIRGALRGTRSCREAYGEQGRWEGTGGLAGRLISFTGSPGGGGRGKHSWRPGRGIGTIPGAPSAAGGHAQPQTDLQGAPEGGQAALFAFVTAGPAEDEMPPQKSRIPTTPSRLRLRRPGAVLPVRAPRGHLLATGKGPLGGRATSGRRTSRIYQLLATVNFCICQGANYCF